MSYLKHYFEEVGTGYAAPIMKKLTPLSREDIENMRKRKTTLSENEVRKSTDAIMKIFETDRKHNIVYITDDIILYLVGAYGVTSEQAYDIMDKYQRLQDTYKGMVYQHLLYKRGEITEHQFITMCRGIYHTGEIENEN